MWFKVLIARYAMDDGRVREGRQSGSSWWNQLLAVRKRDDGLEVGQWFDNNLVQVVGDEGKYTVLDRWLVRGRGIVC